MWRSLLFVPALEERLIQGAARRGADAVVLDLEAAVPEARKVEARQTLATSIPHLTNAGASVAVRVNLLEHEGRADLESAVEHGASIIVLPRATLASTAQAATLAGDGVSLIPLVEDPRGVINALAIAEAAGSIVGLGLGVEDYATEMGAAPTPELLVPAAFQVIQAARAAGCEPLILPDTIAEYRDVPRFEAAADTARKLGASGGFAIHPAQVAVLNRVFMPTDAEVEHARLVLKAADNARANGQAVATLNGQMIDAPITARASAVLQKARLDEA